MFQQLLREEAVCLGVKPAEKKRQVFESLFSVAESLSISEKQKKHYIDLLIKREEMGTTAVGDQLALPHAFCADLQKPVVVLGISPEGVEFGSLDGDLVHIFLMTLLPESEEGRVMKPKILQKAQILFSDRFTRQLLKQAQDSSEVLDIIRRESEALNKLAAAAS